MHAAVDTDQSPSRCKNLSLGASKDHRPYPKVSSPLLKFHTMVGMQWNDTLATLKWKCSSQFKLLSTAFITPVTGSDIHTMPYQIWILSKPPQPACSNHYYVHWLKSDRMLYISNVFAILPLKLAYLSYHTDFSSLQFYLVSIFIGQSLLCYIHCESKKKLGHFYFYCNFGKCW